MGLFLAVSFFIFFAFYEREQLFELLVRRRAGHAFARTNRWMTRHAKAHKPPDDDRSLEMIVFNYIIDFLWPRILRLIIRKALKAAGTYPRRTRSAASEL
jgi:hypothetical protein